MSAARLSVTALLQGIPTAWKVGLTAVAILGSVAAATRTGFGLLRTPAQIAAHDSAMRAEADSSLREQREMVKQQKLTNCILLGLESKLACTLHASH